MICLVLGTLGSFGTAGVASLGFRFRFSPEEGTEDAEAWLDEPLFGAEGLEPTSAEEDDLDEGFDDEYLLWWQLGLYERARGMAPSCNCAREDTKGDDWGATPATRRTVEGIIF